VIFSGFAQLAVAPTEDRDELLAALDAVTTGRGTTIGAAILRSIDAIAELDPNVAPSDPVDEPTTDGPGIGGPTPTPRPTAGGPAGAAVDVAPEIIVLLTDGANTRGVTPSQAAEQAAARGVRVYPIGFGTTNPTQMACTRDQYGSFSVPSNRDLTGAGAGALGGRSFLVVDEPALRNVANKTGGTYFAATDADGLTKVLADLPKHVTVSEQDIDLSAAFGLLAALVLLTGLRLSIGRHRPL
jgi:Ca-activated chloride channel family protein